MKIAIFKVSIKMNYLNVSKIGLIWLSFDFNDSKYIEILAKWKMKKLEDSSEQLYWWRLQNGRLINKIKKNYILLKITLVWPIYRFIHYHNQVKSDFIEVEVRLGITPDLSNS